MNTTLGATPPSGARYARTVVLYWGDRKFLPADGTFHLGVWEIPN